MAAGGTASPAAMIQRTVSTRRQGCASPGCKKRSPPLTPLRDNRLPTVRWTFQYQSRYRRESLVCILDTGRLMGGPFLEMFARGSRSGWTTWRSEAAHYVPDWPTCAHHSQAHAGKDRPPRRNARREAKRKRGTLDQEKLKDSSPFDFVPASAVRPAS